ncbi:MAG: nucleoside-triphosphatase [Candidatus Heimdallarchaeaceae archaeon]
MNERKKNFKILITGPPGSGKSTLIIRLINFLIERGQKIKGFLTPEVRISNKRIGFNLEDIETKQQLTLARVGKKFQVFLKNIFTSEYNVIATIGLNIKHLIQDVILKMQDIQYYTLNVNNREEIFNRITFYLEEWLKGKRIK